MNAPAGISDLFRGALLAPMLTTTDIPFRAICKEFGATLATTEMVSARGIIERASASYRYAVIDRAERPVSIQLLTSSPGDVAHAIHELLPLQPTVFDINAGCPSERVCIAGGGAELLDDLPRLLAVVSAAVKASGIPVSVKLRAGGLGKREPIESIAKTVEDSGAAFLTVHARERQVKYNVHANWEIIARAKQAVRIPVVGNGDVFSSADAAAMKAETGCDAVMVARGALGTPWIFRDISLGRKAGITDFMPEHDELGALALRHMTALAREFGHINAVPRMRKHFLWYVRWYENVEDVRKTLFLKEDARFVLDVAEEFFETPAARIAPDSREFQEVEQRFRKRVLFWTIPSPATVPV